MSVRKSCEDKESVEILSERRHNEFERQRLPIQQGLRRF